MSDYVRRVADAEASLGSRLAHLDVELTERCDNDCVHCCINRPVGDPDARALELTTEEWKDVFRQAADLGCLQVRMTGGEPTLRPDFEELYLAARKLGLRVLLFTNGRRITPGLADLFARIPPRVAIEITVYGMRQKSYEAVTRARGSFAQFRRGVDLLLDRRVPFVVKSVILPQNVHEFEEFQAWAATLPGTRGPARTVASLSLRGRRDDDAKNRLIESLRLGPQILLAALARDDARYREEMGRFARSFMGPAGDRLFACGAGCSVAVDAYGRVQPCLDLRAEEWRYDLRHSAPGGLNGLEPRGLAAALDSLLSRVREARATGADYLRRCAVCFLKGLCEQCPARSYAETSTLDTPVEHLCEAAHAQARHLGWLGENERAWDVRDWRERTERGKAR